jgi:hypothetical protein
MTHLRVSLLAAMTLLWCVGAQAGTCETLAALTTSKVEIFEAKAVAAGSFTPPDASNALPQLPAFCRVVVKLKPTADSDIGAEVWLPANWNTKLLVLGNGGWGGAINYYDEMAVALRRGYAVAAPASYWGIPRSSSISRIAPSMKRHSRRRRSSMRCTRAPRVVRTGRAALLAAAKV